MEIAGQKEKESLLLTSIAINSWPAKEDLHASLYLQPPLRLRRDAQSVQRPSFRKFKILLGSTMPSASLSHKASMRPSRLNCQTTIKPFFLFDGRLSETQPNFSLNGFF
jgi:hypothetical protein